MNINLDIAPWRTNHKGLAECVYCELEYQFMQDPRASHKDDCAYRAAIDSRAASDVQVETNFRASNRVLLNEADTCVRPLKPIRR